MIQRDDEAGVRDLLEAAARPVADGAVAPESTWASGRRRRTGKRAGAGLLGALAATGAAVVVWQAGMTGGRAQPVDLPAGPADIASATGDPARPSTGGPAAEGGAATEGAGGPAFLTPGAESTGGPWPDGEGELLAPAVRVGRHEGFDRVVVDLTGTGPVGWHAAYTAAPTAGGSGLLVEVAGDSVLEITLSGMALPAPGDRVYDDGELRVATASDLDVVAEVVRTTPHEGQLRVLLGVAGEPRPYRVFALEEPLRLVVDIQR